MLRGKVATAWRRKKGMLAGLDLISIIIQPGRQTSPSPTAIGLLDRYVQGLLQPELWKSRELRQALCPEDHVRIIPKSGVRNSKEERRKMSLGTNTGADCHGLDENRQQLGSGAAEAHFRSTGPLAQPLRHYQLSDSIKSS